MSAAAERGRSGPDPPEPFEVSISEAGQDLHRRIIGTRWRDDLDNRDRGNGIPAEYLPAIARAWRKDLRALRPAAAAR